MPNFSGINLQPRLIRSYPYSEATSHVVGYLGAISKNDLIKLNRSSYDPNEKIGKTGSELFNEDHLHGVPGFNQFIANARGREIPIKTESIFLEKKLPEPGSNIYLTVDLELQRLATELLGGRKGAVVAIDPNNAKAIFAYSDGGGATFEAKVLQLPYSSTTTNLTAENFIGISNGVYTNGQTATIQISGSVDDAQSSLTPGQQYYVQVDGTLSETADSPSVLAGTAIAATKLAIG